MSRESEETRVEEPEVLPPDGQTGTARPRRSQAQAIEIFGPIAVGVAIDAVDFMAHGPIGLMIGMFVGGTLAYAFTTYYGMPVWKRMLWASAAGLYCLLPRTEFIPLATIVAAAVRYMQVKK
ncbi:MAG: hypothetical protein O3B24_06805 [Verrucomicrobia bacterium]|nr:hypothetical protein [Verrucomicrobiota bacterium]